MSERTLYRVLIFVGIIYAILAFSAALVYDGINHAAVYCFADGMIFAAALSLHDSMKKPPHHRYPH